MDSSIGPVITTSWVARLWIQVALPSLKISCPPLSILKQGY